ATATQVGTAGELLHLRVGVVLLVEQVHAFQGNGQVIVDLVGNRGVHRGVVHGPQVAATADVGEVLVTPVVGHARGELLVLVERGEIELVLGVVGQRTAIGSLAIGVGVVGDDAETC